MMHGIWPELCGTFVALPSTLTSCLRRGSLSKKLSTAHQEVWRLDFGSMEMGFLPQKLLPVFGKSHVVEEVALLPVATATLSSPLFVSCGFFPQAKLSFAA